AQVELKIYNIKGELVKDLYSGISDYKSLQWNGTDDTGKQLSPGIYFYNLTVNGKSQEIKKLILMR
ncbi:MAG: gliding motility-associated C-terminal domain-containing protein, partial [Candidatus Celaenobacter antarcticus]|nr:gliding motility-associated C-terminal domain-containing protein [Candidatus Celaenobacter antarcticus]